MPTGPRPAPPDSTVRVAFVGTILGHKYVSGHWLRLTHGAGVTVDELAAIETEIRTTLIADVYNHLASEVGATIVELNYYNTAGDLAYVGSTSFGGGGSSGAVQDAGACFVVDGIISASWRGGHPRMCLPGVRAADVTNGSDISSSVMSSLVSGVNSYRNALNAFTTTGITQVEVGTVSFQSAKAWRSPPVFYPWTSVKAGKGSKLGSQRRRILS